MMRVSPKLARGIVVAAALFCAGGPLVAPVHSPTARAVAHVRSQDFTPIFDLAGRRISAYFDPRKETLFLDEIFSLSGKWKAVAWSRASYERYIQESFEKCVFSPADFEKVLVQIRSDYAYTLAAAENRLLVAVYADVHPARPELSFDAFKAEYAGLAGSLAPEVIRDLGMNFISLAGSDAAAVLFVAAMSSAGIFGSSVAAGGAGGPLTFGVSLAVGIVAGIALDAIVGAAYEDAARMKLRGHINELRNRVIDQVHEALVRAILAYRTLQERCVVRVCEGGSHEFLARRP